MVNYSMDFVSQLNDARVCIVRNGKQVVSKLQVCVSLQITYPRRGDAWKLCTFAGGENQCYTALNPPASVVVSPTEKLCFSLCFSTEPVPPDFVHFWLYRTSKDAHVHVPVQVLVGCGYVDLVQMLKREVEVQLVDANDATQATLKVTFNREYNAADIDTLLRILPSTGADPHWMQPMFDRMIEYASELYARVRYDSLQYFVYTETPVGRLPLLCFPLLVTQVKVDAAAADHTLMQYARVAALHLNMSSDDIAGCDDTQCAQVIGEICTLAFRALVYISDESRAFNVPENKEDEEEASGTLTDQWVRIGCFPDLGLAGYDCEDGAEFALEMFHVLKYGKFTSSALRRIQRLARQYTPMLVVSKLTVGNEAVPHAIAAALDTRYVRRLAEGASMEPTSASRMLPAMLFETTNYTESVWTRNNILGVEIDHARKRVEESVTHTDVHNRFYACFTDHDRSGKWRSMIKCKTQVVDIVKQNIYPSFTALLTADYHDAQGQYRLLHMICMTEQRVVGVLPQDLLTYSSLVRVATVRPLLSGELQRLQRLVGELPPSQFPTVPDDVAPPMPAVDAPHKYIFNMRTLDYEANQVQVDKAVHRFATHTKTACNMQHIVLAESGHMQLTILAFS